MMYRDRNGGLRSAHRSRCASPLSAASRSSCSGSSSSASGTLQVLSGDKYRAEANNNQIRDITVQAPRGRIVDVNGRCSSTTASATRSRSTPRSCRRTRRPRCALYQRLSGVLGMSAQQIAQTVNKQFLAAPFGKATVKDGRPGAGLHVHPREPEQLPGRHRRAGVPARLPAPRRRRRSCSARSAGSASRSCRRRPIPRRSTRATGSASRGSSPPTTATCAGSTAPTAYRSTRSARSAASSSVRAPRVGSQLRLTLDSNLEQTGQDAMQGQTGGVRRDGHPLAARSRHSAARLRSTRTSSRR